MVNGIKTFCYGISCYIIGKITYMLDILDISKINWFGMAGGFIVGFTAIYIEKWIRGKNGQNKHK